jgi:hypothetical protein
MLYGFQYTYTSDAQKNKTYFVDHTLLTETIFFSNKCLNDSDRVLSIFLQLEKSYKYYAMRLFIIDYLWLFYAPVNLTFFLFFTY